MKALLAALDRGRRRPMGRAGWRRRTPGCTAAEVRHLLREGGQTARGSAVACCAARPSDWLPAAPDPRACPDHDWRRLPTILRGYRRGASVALLARRLTAHGEPGGVERALDTACRRIAHRLNRDPAAYGLDR